MLASKRELLVIVVLAVLLYVEQLASGGHPPEVHLARATRELHLQAHAWAGRAQTWLLSLLPELGCKGSSVALSIRCIINY